VRRDGRVAEGARLESVFRGNSNVGSNPTLSAIQSAAQRISLRFGAKYPLSAPFLASLKSKCGAERRQKLGFEALFSTGQIGSPLFGTGRLLGNRRSSEQRCFGPSNAQRFLLPGVGPRPGSVAAPSGGLISVGDLLPVLPVASGSVAGKET
jgi:hypothetical protein